MVHLWYLENRISISLYWLTTVPHVIMLIRNMSYVIVNRVSGNGAVNKGTYFQNEQMTLLHLLTPLPPVVWIWQHFFSSFSLNRTVQKVTFIFRILQPLITQWTNNHRSRETPSYCSSYPITPTSQHQFLTYFTNIQ
jgi:hypothetical protein